MPFAVVNTVEKGQSMFCYCPENWIEDDEVLWWPPRNLEKKVIMDDSSIKEEGWTNQPCEVKFRGLSRESAMNIVGVLVRSNTDNEEEGVSKYLEQEKPKKRDVRREKTVGVKRNFNDAFSEASSSSGTGNTLVAICSSPSPGIIEGQSVIIEEEISSVDNGGVAENQISGNDILLSDSILQSLVPVSKEDFQLLTDRVSNQEQKQDQMLKQISLQISEMMTMMHNLTVSHADLLQASAGQSVKMDKMLMQSSSSRQVAYTSKVEIRCFPLKSEEELNKFEADLTEGNFDASIRAHLKSLGGTSGTENGTLIAHKIVNHMFKNHLLQKFSWTGATKTEPKLAFNKFQNVITLMYQIIKLADDRYSLKNFESFMKNNILKNGNARAKAEHKKEEKLGKQQ
ncbi:uncharacterized protein DMENIID0001_005150 [Sergentomyia squamirostris]